MRDEPVDPGWMSLGNMRQNGATSVDLHCHCGHHATVDVGRLPDAFKVPAVRTLYRCSECGARPYSSRPHWAAP